MASGVVVKQNKVFFGGHDVEDLVKKYNSPVYMFCEQRLIDNYHAFYNAFSKHYKNVHIYYSIKTNSEIQLLQTLKKLGSRGEAASGLEVEIAKKAGFSGSDLIVDGPAWTDEEIELYIKSGLKTLNVDSMDEMIRVNRIAKKLNKIVRVSFRVYLEIQISLLKSFIENYISKFGVPLSKAVETYKAASKLSNVKLVSISTHIGSMITDPSFYEKAIDRLVKLAANLKSIGIEVEEINLGGGYGLQSLNYYSIQNIILSKAGISAYSKAASIEEFGQRIGQRFSQNIKRYKLPEVELILEPGRFLVSDAGVLLTKVVAVKDKWIFIDGGINLIPESLFFIRRGFIVAGKVSHKGMKKYNIAGPTLNTADVLSADQSMPKLEVGDAVVVLDSGAYSISRSNQFTILRPEAHYVTKSGTIKKLRDKEKYSEVIDKMIIK